VGLPLPDSHGLRRRAVAAARRESLGLLGPPPASPRTPKAARNGDAGAGARTRLRVRCCPRAQARRSRNPGRSSRRLSRSRGHSEERPGYGGSPQRRRSGRQVELDDGRYGRAGAARRWHAARPRGRCRVGGAQAVRRAVRRNLERFERNSRPRAGTAGTSQRGQPQARAISPARASLRRGSLSCAQAELSSSSVPVTDAPSRHDAPRPRPNGRPARRAGEPATNAC
jgi:hypothetical protein